MLGYVLIGLMPGIIKWTVEADGYRNRSYTKKKAVADNAWIDTGINFSRLRNFLAAIANVSCNY